MPTHGQSRLPRYSVKDLLLSAAFVAGGLALLVLVFRESALGDGAELACWFGGGALIGAGLFAPLRKPWIGAAVGAAIQLLILQFALSLGAKL